MVCRVFKKKNQNRGFQQEIEEEEHLTHMRASGPCQVLEPKHHHMQGLYDYTFDGSMHLPQLFSPESAVAHTSLASSMNAMDILECSQNLLRLTTTTGCGLNLMQQPGERFNGDWSFLDKLLASHHGTMDQHHHPQSKCNNPPTQHAAAAAVATSSQKFPFHYLGCENHDIMKFSK